MKKTALLISLLLILSHIYGNDPIPPVKNVTGNINSYNEATALSNEFFYPVKGFYFNVSPSYSNLLFKNYQLNMDFLKTSDENLISGSGFGFSLNAGYFKSLKPNIKLLVGVGMESYNESINAETLAGIKDNDDDPLDLQFIPSSEWSNSYTYISVPLVFEIGNSNIEKLSFYFDMGVGFSYLINKSSIESDNTFGTNGYYKENLGNVEFENVDIPALDFYTNKSMTVNPFNPYIIGGAGLTFPISKTAIIKAGIVTNIGLSNVYNDYVTNKLDNIGFSVGFYFFSQFDSNQ
jgi:hypothetical protein